jgi:hypothetical protein
MSKSKLPVGRVAYALYVIFLGFLSVEIAGFALFYRHSHRFIYGNLGTIDNPAVINQGRPIDVGGVLHPYFAYVKRPESGTNQFGFVLTHEVDGTTCCQIPYVPKPNEIVVAVFGGSVPENEAQYFANDDNLLYALSPYPEFLGKRFKILNLSQSGFKQPQSSIVLSYFLSIGRHIDIAITLDGRNELFVPMENESRHLDYTWPTVWWDVAKSLDRLNASSDRGQGINIAYQGWQSLRYSYNAAQCHVGACYVLYQLLAQYYGSQEKALVSRVGDVLQSTNFFGGDSGDHPVPLYAPSLEQTYQEAANFWGRSVRNMAALAQANGVTYLHFLQPVRHFMSSDTSIDAQTPAEDKPIKLGYPIMKRLVSQLRKEGYNVFDLTEIFEMEPREQMYVDECCHLSARGSQLMTGRIAKEIAAVYRKH